MPPINLRHSNGIVRYSSVPQRQGSREFGDKWRREGMAGREAGEGRSIAGTSPLTADQLERLPEARAARLTVVAGLSSPSPTPEELVANVAALPRANAVTG